MAKFTQEQTAARCKEVFSKFDSNSDGVIDVSELREGLKELGQFSDSEVNQLMNEADLDKNGVIDEEEFSVFAGEVFAKTELAAEEKMKDLFDKYDLDNDGLIGPDEVYCITQDLSFTDVSIDDAEKIVNKLDVDGDGKINYTELKSFLC